MASSIELSNKTGGAAGPPSSVSSSQRDSEVFDEVEDESDEETPLAECYTKVSYTVFDLTVGTCFNCNSHREHQEVMVSDTDIDIHNMKETLKYHFMNPFQKWTHPTKKQFPWLLIVQLLSIILVTTQLVLFANSKFIVTEFLHANKKTFIKLFVIDAEKPAFSNPLPSPIRLIYTNDELFEQLNHTAFQYFHLEDVSVGPYGYQWDPSNGTNQTMEPHLNLKILRHMSGDIDPTVLKYEVSPTIITDVYAVHNTSDPIGDALSWEQLESDLPSLVAIHLDFTVTSAYLPDGDKVAKCFQFNISFEILKSHDKGIMPVDMDVDTVTRPCDSSKNTISNMESLVIMDSSSTVVDVFVIFISVISIIFCLRALFYSFWLCKTVRSFFIRKFSWKLKRKHFWPLIDGWRIMITVSNGMVIIGSIMKLVIAYSNPDSTDLVDVTSIILGLAVFGQWCGLFRFLSYLETYNILIITLKIALPSVLRFAVCVGILYISFLLLGWLVLGPYHPKFRDTTVTSECLFALINGDDVFNTYAQMSHMSTTIWVFSKMYVYVFVALFIYIVLSVFISLISATYETLNDRWKTRTRGLLKDFATDQLKRGQTKVGIEVSQPPEDAEDYAKISRAVRNSVSVSTTNSELNLNEEDPPNED